MEAVLVFVAEQLLIGSKGVTETCDSLTGFKKEGRTMKFNKVSKEHQTIA